MPPESLHRPLHTGVCIVSGVCARQVIGAVPWRHLNLPCRPTRWLTTQGTPLRHWSREALSTHPPLASGMAWPAELQYMPPTEYLEAHKRAREERRGLFADKNPIHPAQWRNRKNDTLAARIATDEARIRAMIDEQK